MNKQTKFEKVLDFLAGKGFYIILFVCVAAIGVSGYALFFASDDKTADIPDVNSNVDWLVSVPPAVTPPPATPKPSSPSLEAPDDGGAISVTKPTEVPIVRPSASPSPSPSVKPSASPSSPTPSPAPKALATQFFWPVSGEIAVKHYELYNSKTLKEWKTHVGIDLETNLGAKVMAAGDGVVKNIDSDPQLGTYVTIQHSDGIVTLYANLQKNPAVIIDQKVSAGDLIGGVGSTSKWEEDEAPHLHFEMYKDGKLIDPLQYLPKKG